MAQHALDGTPGVVWEDGPHAALEAQIPAGPDFPDPVPMWFDGDCFTPSYRIGAAIPQSTVTGFPLRRPYR